MRSWRRAHVRLGGGEWWLAIGEGEGGGEGRGGDEMRGEERR